MTHRRQASIVLAAKDALAASELRASGEGRVSVRIALVVRDASEAVSGEAVDVAVCVDCDAQGLW